MLTGVAPNNAVGHFQLGNLMVESGEKVLAHTTFKKALERKPDHESAAKALNSLGGSR